MIRKAPEFSCADKDGKLHTLADYAGSWLVVYFYPRDDTPGCTVEACEFRDSYERLQVLGINVLGVSRDTAKSHANFAQKHALPFPLLSDPDHVMIDAFGAWGEKKFMGKIFDGIMRKTYIIDPQGMIVHEFETVSPKGHASQVYNVITELMKKG